MNVKRYENNPIITVDDVKPSREGWKVDYVLKRLFLLAAFALPSLAGASELYVSPSGNDANAGTLDAPLYTVQAAVDRMQAGGTCLIRGGTYREAVLIKASGKEGQPLRLQAFPVVNGLKKRP